MDVFAKEKIDTVLHFAAESHVDHSFERGGAFIISNVMGTFALLDQARKHMDQIKLFVHVSSDEVYGDTPVSGSVSTEIDRLNPTNQYAASKAAAEMFANMYCTAYGLPVIITRGNNVYGSHQALDKVIPKFSTLLARGKR